MKEFIAKTVEEAKRKAVIEFGVTEEELDIEILEKESKGLLGLFGGRDAKIRVELKEKPEEIIEELSFEENISNIIENEEDPVELANRVLRKILDKIYVNCEIETKLENNSLNIELIGENMALVIGKRGKTLDSLSYIISVIVNNNRKKFLPVRIDTQNYRKKREESLKKLARNMASKAKRLRKDIILNPMNSYERRIIHTELQSIRSVKTRSEGKEPNRKIIIFLNK